MKKNFNTKIPRRNPFSQLPVHGSGISAVHSKTIIRISSKKKIPRRNTFC
jgi:hypothetical protein